MTAQPDAAKSVYSCTGSDNAKCSHTSKEHARILENRDNYGSEAVEEMFACMEGAAQLTSRLTAMLPTIAAKQKELGKLVTELEQALPGIEREAHILSRLTPAQKNIFCRLLKLSVEQGGYVDIKSLSKRGKDKRLSECERIRNLKLLRGRDAKDKRWQRGSPLIQKLVIMSAEVVNGRTYACYKPIGLLATLWRIFHLSLNLTRLIATGYGSLICTNRSFLHLFQMLDELKRIGEEERNKLILTADTASVAMVEVSDRIVAMFPAADTGVLTRGCDDIKWLLAYAENTSKIIGQNFNSLLASEPDRFIIKIIDEPLKIERWVRDFLDIFDLIEALYRMLLFFGYSDKDAGNATIWTAGSMKGMLPSIDTLLESLGDLIRKRMASGEKNRQIVLLLDEWMKMIIAWMKEVGDELDRISVHSSDMQKILEDPFLPR